MPFTQKDVKKYNKKASRSPKERAQWVATANSVLAKCIERGGSDESCAPQAIRIANGVVKEDDMKKHTHALPIHQTAVDIKAPNGVIQSHLMGMAEEGTPPELLNFMSAYFNEEELSPWQFIHHEPVLNSPANLEAVNLGLGLIHLAELSEEDSSGVQAHLRSHRLDAGLSEAMGEREIQHVLTQLVKMGQLREGRNLRELEARLRLQENGVEMAPMSIGGAPKTFADLAAQRAAMDKADRMSNVVSDFWHLFWNTWEDAFMEVSEKIGQLDELYQEFTQELVKAVMKESGIVFTEGGVNTKGKITEQINDLHITMDETQLGDGEPTFSEDGAKPIYLEVELIQPGWGNARDNFFYPAPVLRRDAHIFEGVKMYKTGHDHAKRTEDSEVGIVEEIIGFSENGAPRARVAVIDPIFAQKTAVRDAAGHIESLECSIVADGTWSPGEVDDRPAKIVESLTTGFYVDWVPKAGAGGHAVGIMTEGENSENEGEMMEVETTTQPTDTSEEIPAEEVPTTEPETQEETTDEETQEDPGLTEAEVELYLLKKHKGLPALVASRLMKESHQSYETLSARVQEEIEYVKAMTGAGKPKAFGTPIAEEENLADPVEFSESDSDAGFNAIFVEHGLSVQEK